jgi:hypothetical protein
MLAFCAVTITPTAGANKGKPYPVQRRTGFDVKGDRGSVYLMGPDGAPMGAGVGESKPTWSIDTELEEARAIQKHIGGGTGAGFSFVPFDVTFTHQAPGRAKITDIAKGCRLLEDGTTGKAGDNTTTKIGGNCVAYWPNGIDPLDVGKALG